MAKRPTVEVDEEYLKEMMTGEVPRFKREAKRQEVQQEEDDDEKDEERIQPSQAKEPAKPVRRRKEAQDYESLFLARKPSVQRKQTYVSNYILDKINHFLPVIAKQVSITAYIDNILSHHLEQYQDEINDLYDKNYKKPFGHGKE